MTAGEAQQQFTAMLFYASSHQRRGLISKCIKILEEKQKTLGRTNHLLSFDTTWNGIENNASNN
jgi:hypothetical protein